MGADATNGLLLVGLVDANGAADFMRADGAQFVGQAAQSGSSVTFTLQGTSQFGSTFGSGGPTYGSGTFDATATGGGGGAAMSGTVNFTPNAGSAPSWQWGMSFNAVYNDASSLTAISGSYGDTAAATAGGVDPLQGASVTISTAGAMTGQNPNNSCVLNGTVSVVDATRDVYQVSYTLSNCVDTASGTFSALNGVAFTGLAYQDPGYNPAIVLMGVTGADTAGHHYGIISQLSVS